jgi:hypothetical protein
MAARKKKGTIERKAKRGVAKLEAALRRVAKSLNGSAKPASSKRRAKRASKAKPPVEPPGPAKATVKRARRPSQTPLPKRRRATSAAGGGLAATRRSR